MNKEKGRVPKLRFPGFTEDWEQRKLGNLTQLITKGTTPKVKNIQNGINFIKVENISDDGVISINSYVSEEEHMNYLSRSILANNDILFSIAGTLGRTAIVKSHLLPANTNQALAIIRLNKSVDVEYINTFLKSNAIKTYIRKNPTVGAQPNLSLGQVSDLEINIPNYSEQKKISNLFSKFDLMITLHQRKLEHLNLKKKALLQKLFPKNGERYPELRFPGFTDAWEQRKLGSIGSTYTGLSGKTKEDFGHGEAKYITYLNVFQNTISNITMTDKVEIDPTQNEVKYGDVLFTTSSETPEEVGMSSVWLGDTPNIYLNSFCFGFRPNQKIDSYFLGYSLRAPYMRDKIKILAQGISRYNISKNKVMELEISLPNNEEQKLLGTFLQRIDLIITLHQCKLEHLQLQKKALLQQMFV